IPCIEVVVFFHVAGSDFGDDWHVALPHPAHRAVQGRSEAGFGGSEKASPRIGAMSRPADSFADLFRGKARFSNPYGVDLRMYIFRLFFPPQQASRFRRGKLKGALPLQPGEEIAEGVLDVGACPPLKPFILDRSG